MAALPFAVRAEPVRQDFHFQTLTTEQGLAQNTINAVLQDRIGFIWIGTSSGLQQYDGYAFKTFEHSSDSADSAPDGPVSALAEDADGRIWIGTNTFGLVRYTLSAGSFTQMNPAPADGASPAPTVHALLFDAQRGLWIGSDADVTLVDSSNGQVLQRTKITGSDGRPSRIRTFCLDVDGTLWIAGSDGLWRLQPTATEPEQVAAGIIHDARTLLLDQQGQLNVATADGLFRVSADGSPQRIWPIEGRHLINALAEDARGRLWLAVPHEGLAILDSTNGTTQWLRPGGSAQGKLPDARITNLTIDRSGLLWIGTIERGITRVDPDGTAFRHVVDTDTTRKRTAANYLRSVFEDASGGVWLGTQGGLKRYLPKERRFEHYDDLAFSPPLAHPGRIPLIVTGFADAGEEGLWVATNLGAGRLDVMRRTLTFLPLDDGAGHGIADTDIRTLLQARDGSLWFGTGRAGIAHYDPQLQAWASYRVAANGPVIGGLSGDTVLALHEARDGRIWAGGPTGLNLIDPAQGQVQVFRHDPANARSLPSDRIRALHETRDGTLWIGTQAGLARLDGLDVGQARFTRWLTRDGLPSGTVYAIESDSMGRLWMSTNRGITTLDLSVGKFRTFTLADGLQGMEFNGGVSTHLANGDLAFGGINGLNLFSPQAIVASRYPAPVVVTRVDIGGQLVPTPRSDTVLQMPVSERIVRFEFAALDFAAPERNHFSYRLEGFDEHWIQAGTRHDATYTNLDPGLYTFQVRASNRDGYWNDRAASIALRVTPPWWGSVAAKTAYLVGGMGGLLLAWRLQRRRHHEERSFHRDLQEREDRLRLALWGSGDDFWDWDFARKEVMVTSPGELVADTRTRPAAMPETWFSERMHPADLVIARDRLEQHIAGATETFECEYRLRNRRDTWTWMLVRGKIVERDAGGQPLRMCGTARNITAAHAAEQDRRVAQEVIRSMAEAVAVSDLDFRFLTVNPAFTKITGWRQNEVEGRSATLLNCAQHQPDYYASVRDTLARTGHWRGEMWQRRKRGDEFLSWSEISEVRDANGVRTHFVSVISDITDRKRAEQELRYLANYDALTGLPNRTLLTERIGEAIIRARHSSRRVAVLFLDLDRFKHVNDSMGHATGDRMLRAAGSRLRQIVREGDSVARLGGDEFTVVLDDLVSGIEAAHVAQKIIAAFEQPLELDNGQEAIISPSIGISLYPDHGQMPSDLLKCADTAMYQAKEHGRRTWMIYTEAMDAAARLRATMVAALRKALERNELSLVYQPKLSLLDERITGVEALLRWRSSELGDISPGVFIPIAEETGMIIEIGDWVVAQACAELSRWHEAGIRDLCMSINISVAQLLRGDLIQRLCEVLAEHDIAPNQIELELTESMVMANAEQSITTLRKLKAVGVNLAIDDFGTGYSSLAYLKRLPIDTLKIDKEFVGDITTDPDDEAITATVITMAHSLGLNVVAEGVERADQLEYLREQDCDEIQGHWLSYPLPPQQCLRFLRERAVQRSLVLGESSS